ncbi:MAG: M28 family metallopeptidase [Luteimonas sp.]
MRRAAALLLLLVVLAACKRDDDRALTASTPGDSAAQRIEADVRQLADDRMEGREAGTRGYALASAYVAERYRQIGLQPAGDDGSWFQSVPLLKATRQAQGARLAVLRDGKTIQLRFREQFLPALNYNAAEHALEAPAVFVGQGVQAPELQHDDFAGLDVRGKIAVLFSGAPSRFDNDRRAFHASTREKMRALAEGGAVGVILVNTPEEEARNPWARQAANWERPGMWLRDAEGRGIDSWPQLQAAASVSAAAADALFAGSGRNAAQLFKAAQDGTLRGFALSGTIALAGRTRIEPAESRNVVGKLRGSNASLAGEHIVYSAHLDHLGIGAEVNGDAIYNGALDNALGVSIMLEAARELAETKSRPRRSLLFVALTAEEKGLLGAEWFAAHPTVAAESLIANLNMDMPVLLAPSRDVVPIGIGHSSLKGVVEAAAKQVGVALSPDPFPEEVVFVRSDQYAFIRAGIPAVYLDGGVLAAAASAGKAADVGTAPKLALREFLRNCSHQPCDDTSQPIQYADAARLARLNARIGTLVGNAAQRPRWNDGDFFGERFAQP